MEPSTTPQPIRLAKPPVVTADSIVTTQQVPFTTTWVVQVDGHSVEVLGRWSFDTEQQAIEAAKTLLPST